MSRQPKIHVLLADLLAMSKNCGDSEEARIYHASLKDDPKLWVGLELRGYMSSDEDDKRLELRNCARCGSTLAIKIPNA